MKQKKEIIVGVIAFLIIISIIYLTLGLSVLIFFAVLFVVATIAIKLFSNKSLLAKAGAVIIYNDILLKILMPAKYRNKIKELNESNDNVKR